MKDFPDRPALTEAEENAMFDPTGEQCDRCKCEFGKGKWPASKFKGELLCEECTSWLHGVYEEHCDGQKEEI